MDTNSQQASAKIYQFPLGGRAAAGGGRQNARGSTDLAAPRTPKTVAGSGWYHEAAIQEAARAVKG